MDVKASHKLLISFIEARVFSATSVNGKCIGNGPLLADPKKEKRLWSLWTPKTGNKARAKGNICLLFFFLECVLQCKYLGASLAVQWLRICLPMKGTQVWSLVWEDPTWHGANKANYWACVLEPGFHDYWCLPLGTAVPNKKSHRSEKPAHHDQGGAPACTTRERPCANHKDPVQPKII